MTADSTSRGAFGGRKREAASLGDEDRLSASVDGEVGIVLGVRLGGETALPCAGQLALVTLDCLRHHLVVTGATGAGKSETVMRLAWCLASTTDAPIYYLDGKGDRDGAARFCALMRAAGRSPHVFPNERFAGWRGGAHEIHGRLMEVIDYAADGPASWYRDVAKTAVALACDHSAGPPRSSGELLSRLDLTALRATHPGSTAVAALSDQQVRQVRLRYEAFFAQARGALDGSWAWEDTDSAYLLLDSLALREETAGLSRFLFEDFAQYFALRKSREQFCMLIVDEFSSLANGSGMAQRVEQARAYNSALVLVPQVASGMGDAGEAERILGSAQTVILHRVATPEAIVELAGTRRSLEYSSHFELDGATGAGSARLQHAFKVDPNHVRALPTGEAFVIRRGKAMRIRVNRAPEARGTLSLDEATGEEEVVATTTSTESPPRKELPF